MRNVIPYGIGTSLLFVLVAGERSVIATYDWEPSCNLRIELCDPIQKTRLPEGRGTLVNTIGIAASPNAVYAVYDHAAPVATSNGSFTVRFS